MNNRVLVVEDDPDIQFAIKEALELEGYQAWTANHGKEALEVLSKIQTPCCILLDLMMPVMSGWEFLQQKDKSLEFSMIPVLVVSAAQQKSTFPSSVRGLLRKPVELDALFDAIRLCALDSP